MVRSARVGDFVVSDGDCLGYFKEQLIGYVAAIARPGYPKMIQIMEPPGFPGPVPDTFNEFRLLERTTTWI